MESDSLQLERPLSEEEASHLIKQRDANKDGVLSKNELTKPALYTQITHSHSSQDKKKPRSMGTLQLSREQMKEIFREHDIDGDGCLSISELTKAFNCMGSIMPFYKAHYGLAQADADGDGLISEDELDKLIDYAQKFNKIK